MSKSKHEALKSPTAKNPKASKSPKKPNTKPNKRQQLTPLSILIALALCLWTAFSFYAAAFLASLIIHLIPGANSEIPFWSAFFDLILYCINFFILAYLPFYIYKQPTIHAYITQRQKTAKPVKAKTSKTNTAAEATKQKPAAAQNLEITKPTRDSLGLTGAPTWTDLGLAPLGFIAYYIGATLITVLLSFFPWFNLNEAQSLGFDTYLLGIDRLFAFLAIVLIAPIGEEIIFRGWLYPKLRARVGLVLAIILTSLLFALLHGQLNVAADVFVLSVIMCLFREFTGTIYAGILLHVLKNCVAFFLVFVLQVT